MLEFVRDMFVHPKSSHGGSQINLPQRIWILELEQNEAYMQKGLIGDLHMVTDSI